LAGKVAVTCVHLGRRALKSSDQLRDQKRRRIKREYLRKCDRADKLKMNHAQTDPIENSPPSENPESGPRFGRAEEEVTENIGPLISRGKIKKKKIERQIATGKKNRVS